MFAGLLIPFPSLPLPPTCNRVETNANRVNFLSPKSGQCGLSPYNINALMSPGLVQLCKGGGFIIRCILLFTGRWVYKWRGWGGGAYNQKFTVSMFCCPFRIGSFLWWNMSMVAIWCSKFKKQESLMKSALGVCNDSLIPAFCPELIKELFWWFLQAQH